MIGSTAAAASSSGNAWLWQSEVLSDAVLLVYSTEPCYDTSECYDAASDATDGAQASGGSVPGPPLCSIPVHSTVLASASPEHFRNHLSRLWREQQQENNANVPLPQPTCGNSPVRHQLKVQLHPGEPHTVPEAVLCHVYTGTLPDDPEQLIWMMWRADYWDMADTVAACINALQQQAEAKALTLPTAALLSSLPPLQTLKDSAQAVPALLAQITATVFQGPMLVAAEIADSHQLLQQFSRLPLPLLKQWVGLKSVKIDSGNTLAVLFTAWCDAQPTPPTEEQCQELSALLPLSTISVTFHLQVLPHLQWWQPPPGLPPQDHATVRVLSLLNPGSSLSVWWDALLANTCLAAPTTSCASKCWSLPRQRLNELWDKKQLSLDPVSFSGYQVHLSLSLDPSTTTAHPLPRYTIGLRCHMTWHPAVAPHIASGTGPVAGLRLEVRLLPGSHRTRGVAFQGVCWGSGWGWEDVFKKEFGYSHELAPTASLPLKIQVVCTQMQ